MAAATRSLSPVSMTDTQGVRQPAPRQREAGWSAAPAGRNVPLRRPGWPTSSCSSRPCATNSGGIWPALRRRAQVPDLHRLAVHPQAQADHRRRRSPGRRGRFDAALPPGQHRHRQRVSGRCSAMRRPQQLFCAGTIQRHDISTPGGGGQVPVCRRPSPDAARFPGGCPLHQHPVAGRLGHGDSTAEVSQSPVRRELATRVVMPRSGSAARSASPAAAAPGWLPAVTASTRS
jgi:hypothetical protein